MQDGDGVSWPGNISALDTSSPPLLQPSSSPLLSLASQHTTPSILTFCLFIFLPSKLCSIFYSFSTSSIRLLGKVYIYVCVYIGLDLFLLPLLLELRRFLSSTSSKFIRSPCLFFIRGFVSKTWKSICTYMCRFVSSSSSLSLLSLFPLRFHLLFIFSLMYSLFVSKT